MEIKVIEAPKDKRKPIPEDDMKLGFGQRFTDHMFLMNYTEGKGWHDPRIEPYHTLELDPACMILHYGQEVFEGLKAYRGEGGGIYLFRHKKNLERFNNSCPDKLLLDRLELRSPGIFRNSQNFIECACDCFYIFCGNYLSQLVPTNPITSYISITNEDWQFCPDVIQDSRSN